MPTWKKAQSFSLPNPNRPLRFNIGLVRLGSDDHRRRAPFAIATVMTGKVAPTYLCPPRLNRRRASLCHKHQGVCQTVQNQYALVNRADDAQGYAKNVAAAHKGGRPRRWRLYKSMGETPLATSRIWRRASGFRMLSRFSFVRVSTA